MEYLRSLLSTPGQRQNMVEKAMGLSPDGNIFDLEDGVPPGQKDSARAVVAEAIQRPRRPGGPLRFVRVNGGATGRMEDDIRAVVHPGLDGIGIPKVESTAEIEAVDRLLGTLERDVNMPEGSVDLLIAIESALGLHRVFDLVTTSPRIKVVFFGGEDFALDVGLPVTRSGAGAEQTYARSQILVAAATARIFSMDQASMEFRDLDKFRRHTEGSRDLGFTGGWCIHPSQLPIANEIFSPTAEEVELARQVVVAFDEAEAAGLGAVMMGGQLVERPIVERAQRTLRLHEKISRQSAVAS